MVVSGGGEPGDGAARAAAGAGGKKEERRAAAQAREATQGLRKRVKEAEAEMVRLGKAMADIDAALGGQPTPALKLMTMGQLMKRRGDLEKLLASVEADWVEASEALEA
jgi:ATP-binding cassette subfamily F protein 3